MKLTAFLLLVPLVITTVRVCAAPPIRVMTYNIRFDGGATTASDSELPWNAERGISRREMVLEVIAAEKSDLFGLQEALANQVDDVIASGPQYGIYSVGRDDGVRAGEHCSIFYRKSRFEKLDDGTFWLCESADKPGAKHPDAACPRIASWVRLRDLASEDGEIVFVNTHWDHVSQPARAYAAKTILERIEAIASNGRVIVVGDMNAHRDSPEISILLSGQKLPLRDAYRLVHPQRDGNEATFNAFKSLTEGERIDYVFASPHFTPKSAEIIRTTVSGRNPSDHYPVVVELQYARE